MEDNMLDTDEEQPILFCDSCNGDIYEGGVFYNIVGADRLCQECIDDCKEYAEKESFNE